MCSARGGESGLGSVVGKLGTLFMVGSGVSGTVSLSTVGGAVFAGSGLSFPLPPPISTLLVLAVLVEAEGFGGTGFDFGGAGGLDSWLLEGVILSSTGSLISSSIGSLGAASRGSCFCFLRSSDLAFVTAVQESCVI